MRSVTTLVAVAVVVVACGPVHAGSLTTTFESNGGADGMMFDLTAKKTVTLSSFDYRVLGGGGPGVFNTIEVYYVTDHTTFVGKEEDPGLWTLLGRQTVETTAYPPPIHVEIGGLTICRGETVGIYFTEIGVAPTSVARTAGPLGAFQNDDLIFEDRGVAKFYPFGLTFTPRVWNGTIYYDVVAATCPADTNCDGTVDALDLLEVLGGWGPCSHCAGDVNDDGVVDVRDLLEVLTSWGPCP